MTKMNVTMSSMMSNKNTEVQMRDFIVWFECSMIGAASRQKMREYCRESNARCSLLVVALLRLQTTESPEYSCFPFTVLQCLGETCLRCSLLSIPQRFDSSLSEK